MFDENPEIAAMVDLLYEACAPLNRGNMLTRETIQEVVGCEPNTEHWQHVVNKVRRRMERERGISMMPVREVGFTLCTIQEQLDLASYRQRRAARQIRRGERSLKALDGTPGLTVRQRHARALAIESLRATRLQCQREARSNALLVTPTSANPRVRPVPVG